MKSLLSMVSLLIQLSIPAWSDSPPRAPENLTMDLVWIADAGEPKQYVFVLGGAVAYKTLDGLKDHLKGLSKGSTLTWSPGCDRMGDEPLLGSADGLRKFREFCASIGLKFILVPSG
jgi:hypothetical protein